MATRLLAVDADPAVQSLVEQSIVPLGLVATCFKDAVTALDAIGRLKPALVIADYRLTGGTFISFCERLAGMELAPSPPIVALICPGDRFDEAELRFLGVKSFVHKPLQPDDLLQAIRQLCTELGLSLPHAKERNAARPARQHHRNRRLWLKRSLARSAGSCRAYCKPSCRVRLPRPIRVKT